MPYKRHIIVLFFLLISSYSFSANAASEENLEECIQHKKVEKQIEIFSEKVIMMSREYENK